jgi:hypothetical protein
MHSMYLITAHSFPHAHSAGDVCRGKRGPYPREANSCALFDVACEGYRQVLNVSIDLRPEM